MPQTVPGPAKPPPRLGGAAIKPSRRTLPQLLHRVVKVQDPAGIGHEALLKQPPQAPGSITEPDHLGRVPDALAQRFEPQTLLERLDIPEDGYQPALMQPGHELAGPGAMATQAGQHTHFHFMPGRFAPGLPALRAKRDHHPIRAHEQGSCRELGGQGLLGGPVSLGDSLELLVELLHGPPPRGLDPLPHSLGTDRPRTIPAQQHRCRRKWDKDG